ncbi:hypothetical protein J3E69DRAFT_4336 [Trichoderma sp. SZMC 28015]
MSWTQLPCWCAAIFSRAAAASFSLPAYPAIILEAGGSSWLLLRLASSPPMCLAGGREPWPSPSRVLRPGGKGLSSPLLSSSPHFFSLPFLPTPSYLPSPPPPLLMAGRAQKLCWVRCALDVSEIRGKEFLMPGCTRLMGHVADKEWYVKGGLNTRKIKVKICIMIQMKNNEGQNEVLGFIGSSERRAAINGGRSFGEVGFFHWSTRWVVLLCRHQRYRIRPVEGHVGLYRAQGPR